MQNEHQHIFISLVKFTSEGIATLKDEGRLRTNGMILICEKYGGQFLEVYHCLGEYDAIAVMSFSDSETAMKVMVEIASLGHIKTTTFPAVNHATWKKMVLEIYGSHNK